MNLGKSALLCAVALTLAACGSNVRLDDAQVTDAKGTAALKDDPSTQAPGAIQQVQVGDRAVQAALPKDLPLLVYFDFNSDVIKPEFQSVIAGHARHLSRNKSAQVNIEGHTDERGGREFNLALGQNRAEAVRRALNLLGVQDAQMQAVSFGKEKPADTSGTDDGMGKNRRVFFNYR